MAEATTPTNTTTPSSSSSSSSPAGPLLPRVTIRFCTQCKWMLRAAYFAQELLSTFSTSLGEVALQPATGGVFIVEIVSAEPTTAAATAAGISGSDPHVTTRTRVLWDRKVDGGFPETKELKRRVRDVIEPDRNLGHVDRDYHPSPHPQQQQQNQAQTAAMPDSQQQQQQQQPKQPLGPRWPQIPNQAKATSSSTADPAADTTTKTRTPADLPNPLKTDDEVAADDDQPKYNARRPGGGMAAKIPPRNLQHLSVQQQAPPTTESDKKKEDKAEVCEDCQ